MGRKRIHPEGIKAVLFDSGHVLNCPESGTWYFTEKFRELIDPEIIKRNPFRYALARFIAKIFLYSNHDIKTEEEEYHLFKRYYFILLKKSGFERRIAIRLAAEIALDIVYNDDKFVFFDDVEKCLQELESKYLLGIVSDTWPSLERVYRKKALRDYFSCFIISSLHNSKKHKGKLFRIALEDLQVKPQQVIFIDDLDINLEAAARAGMLPVKMDRYGKVKKYGKFPIIRSLDELLQQLQS